MRPRSQKSHNKPPPPPSAAIMIAIEEKREGIGQKLNRIKKSFYPIFFSFAFQAAAGLKSVNINLSKSPGSVDDIPLLLRPSSSFFFSFGIWNLEFYTTNAMRVSCCLAMWTFVAARKKNDIDKRIYSAQPDHYPPQFKARFYFLFVLLFFLVLLKKTLFKTI